MHHTWGRTWGGWGERGEKGKKRGGEGCITGGILVFNRNCGRADDYWLESNRGGCT